MNKNPTCFAPEVLLEEYRRLLRDDPQIHALPLVISGNSMSPFLVHGRDTVYLSRLTRPPKRGDMLLYQRRSGAYVLHRVYRVDDGVCTMVGDAQTVLEPGICEDQIIAVVTAVRRKEKRLTSGYFLWDFFEHIWLCMIPWRPLGMKLYGILRQPKGKE